MSSPIRDAVEGTRDVSVFLGVGSNLGDRRRNIERALELIEARGAGRIVARSRWIETEPVGGPPQGRYLNGVVELRTRLDARALLEALHAVEADLGRVRTVRNAPREIDLDILLYSDMIVTEPDLVIPHPRLCERRFVLEPLAEIAANRVHPATGKTMRDHLKALPASGFGAAASAKEES